MNELPQISANTTRRIHTKVVERSRDMGVYRVLRKVREVILGVVVGYICNSFIVYVSLPTHPMSAMLTKQISLFILGATLLFSCSSGNSADAVAETASSSLQRVVNEVVVSSGEPVTMADLSIEGMSCEMMCGGAIKKALAKMSGVTATEIVFNEGDLLNHAVVTYNEAEVSDAELVAAIQALYDGQYQVKEIAITRQVKGSGQIGTGDVEVSQESKVSVYAPAAILLPSVITILSRILGQ